MAFKVIYTTSDKLPEVTLTPGQLIFTQDDRKVQFVNSNSDLINYTSVVPIPTEAARAAMANPYPALYWIKETATLWRYEEDEGWVQATSPNEEQIVFGERPAVGVANKLYIDGTNMYLYMNGVYIQINGGGPSDIEWLPIE